jgi:Zn-finger nucleic acid-binding protein
MRCPSCSTPLIAKKATGNVDVHTCDGCQGVAVAVPRLVSLLEAIAEPLAAVMNPDEPIEALSDGHPTRPCPKCRKRMEKFGYLGTNLVTVDRCGDDLLLWTDADELGTMALLYLRTKKRTNASAQRLAEYRDGLNRRAHVILTNRAHANRIATGAILGNYFL